MSFDEMFLNIMIIYIPEEIFLVYMTLIIMGRHDYLDTYKFKKNFKRIMMIVVIPYILNTNFMHHILGLNVYARVVINIFSFALLMSILLWSKKIFRIIIASMVVFTIIIITEIFVMIILNYFFNIDTSIFLISPWVNFIITLPGRVIQFALLYMIYLKKNALVDISLYNIWRDNSYFRNLIFVCTFVDIIMGLYMYNKFTVNHYLEVLPINVQLFIVVSLFILLIGNILLPWVTLISIYPSEKYRKRL